MRRIIALLVMVLPALAWSQTDVRPPNIVIFFVDDLGYSDIGCYGAEGFETPNIDRMASEGVRFTNFYAAQPVCSASRAALLTGCYPNRIGILGALFPGSKNGISADETTLAELCKAQGYATAIYGKWHLGHHPPFLPTRHGFDEFLGIPYSNDMWPFHPDLAKFPTETERRKRGYPDLTLIENERVVIPAVTGEDQARFTTLFTERAVSFIEKHRDEPFFVYVPHPMPHVPLFVSEKFEGKSEQGRYGDVAMEIDWSVGRVLDKLKELDLDENTLVIFASDNGPWVSYGDHAGSARPLREAKGTTWDGGVRVPCVMRWPGRIPAGLVQTEPAMAIDILPTIGGIIGAPPPNNTIDGRDILPLMTGEPNAQSPHEALYFYWGGHLQAIRSGMWKLHFPHAYRTLDGRPGGTGGQPVKYDQARTELALYDLDSDVSERANVASAHPEIVARLTRLADQARAELGDSATETTGAGIREPGRID